MTVESEAVGRAMRDARESTGMTQAELAGYLGWSQATVSKVESGTRPLRVDELVACAEALGVDVVELSSSAVVEATDGLADDAPVPR